jgi:hypothetical protein
MLISLLAATVAPSAMLVKKERTLKRPIGTVLAGALPGSEQAQALLGIR